MKRREFLGAAAISLAAGVAAQEGAVAGVAVDGEDIVLKSDGLNPPGIRTAGIRMVPVMAGKYKVWTKRIGRGAVKVLLLHGGPGFSHEYLEAMESFLPEAGVEMYYYDQLGVNNSDQPDDPSLWTLPRYVEEVEEVRRGLGLDHFVLYGHSWGGMLAIDYALKYQSHLRGLVISNMTAGVQAYAKHTDVLRRMLPPDKQVELAALEARADYDSPAYQSLMLDELYPRMVCRLKPWPEPVSRALRHANQTIYNLMQGKSELLFTGNLKDWERWDRLHEIKVKTLTMGATYDEMDPADMRRMASLIPDARAAICPDGSHLSLWDDQVVYFRHLLSFLATV